MHACPYAVPQVGTFSSGSFDGCQLFQPLLAAAAVVRPCVKTSSLQVLAAAAAAAAAAAVQTRASFCQRGQPPPCPPNPSHMV